MPINAGLIEGPNWVENSPASTLPTTLGYDAETQFDPGVAIVAGVIRELEEMARLGCVKDGDLYAARDPNLI